MQEAIVAFHQRAASEQPALPKWFKFFGDFVDDEIRMTRNGHLLSCVVDDDKHCVCPDLLQDPGRIFDPPSADAPIVPFEERPKYFTSLAHARGKYLTMLYDGHVVNCVHGLHHRRFRSRGIECVCKRISEYPERFFRIPENEWLCREITDKSDLKREWMRLNKEATRQEHKFNILCQCLCKTYRYVKSATNGYHLNTCRGSYSIQGPETCGCRKPIECPARFFVEYTKGNEVKVRGDWGYHDKDCSRVLWLTSDTCYGNAFPENVTCDCRG